MPDIPPTTPNPRNLRKVREIARSGIHFGVARVPMTSRLLVAGSDGFVTELDAGRNDSPTRRLAEHGRYVTCVRLAGNVAVSGGYDNRLIWWDIEMNRAIRTIDAAHTRPIRQLADLAGRHEARQRRRRHGLPALERRDRRAPLRAARPRGPDADALHVDALRLRLLRRRLEAGDRRPRRPRRDLGRRDGPIADDAGDAERSTRGTRCSASARSAASAPSPSRRTARSSPSAASATSATSTAWRGRPASRSSTSRAGRRCTSSRGPTASSTSCSGIRAAAGCAPSAAAGRASSSSTTSPPRRCCTRATCRCWCTTPSSTRTSRRCTPWGIRRSRCTSCRSADARQDADLGERRGVSPT